jgi:hypothetical protein
VGKDPRNPIFRWAVCDQPSAQRMVRSENELDEKKIEKLEDVGESPSLDSSLFRD